MPSGKDIRRRIKSINSTKKITRAMEMVSAAKMRRSVQSVLAIRPYAQAAWSVLSNLARAFESRNEGLLEVREVKRVLMLVMASNRGLCGSFNAQVSKKVKEELIDTVSLATNRVGNKKLIPSGDAKLEIDYLTIGKKADHLVRRFGGNIVASFPEIVDLPTIELVRPISKIIIDEYLGKNYDKVVVVYTDFVSALTQKAKIRQLLPISKADIEKQLEEMDNLAKDYGIRASKVEYKVEPNPADVLDFIIPRLLEMQVYHAVLESGASEHSARMLAMRNATDAASEMSSDLTLAYNQIRQGRITQEIAEISAGRAALE
jgi:F-type H+-transporting ATPase subunit gamma